MFLPRLLKISNLIILSMKLLSFSWCVITLFLIKSDRWSLTSSVTGGASSFGHKWGECKSSPSFDSWIWLESSWNTSLSICWNNPWWTWSYSAFLNSWIYFSILFFSKYLQWVASRYYFSFFWMTATCCWYFTFSTSFFSRTFCIFFPSNFLLKLRFET